MTSLQNLWPYALAIVLILAIVIVILLVLVLRKSAKASQFSDGADDEEEPKIEKEPAMLAEHVMMISALGRAKEVMRDLSDLNQYRTSLHLVLGAEGSREPDFLGHLAASAIQLGYEDPMSEGLGFGNGCGFYMFDQGMVFDLAGPQVVAADGVSSDARGWKTVLQALLAMRPKRPADGIIVTVSCADLVSATQNETRLAARANVINRKLWDVQRELGFRLPVYVLVTGCQQLAGFEDFCANVLSESRGEMIGWSSPHVAGVPYSPAWMDNVFDDLHRDLGNRQMELFASAPRPAGVMLFPWSIQSLKKPLRTFANHLFKSSVYHEGMLPRGFYFCGSFQGETAFASELLEKKVFPETGLALPTSRTKMARDRKVHALQIAAIVAVAVFSIGLLLASRGFQHKNDALVPFFADVQSNQTDPMRLLNDMARIDFSHYWSAFVPSSWFGSTDDDLRTRLSNTFENVILQSISAKLGSKAQLAMDEATQRMEAPPGQRRFLLRTSFGEQTLQPIDEMNEFIALKKYVEDLRRVEQHADMLSDIAQLESGDISELADLVTYAFGAKLDDSFFRNEQFFDGALHDTKMRYPYRPAADKVRASEALRTVSDRFYRQLYDNNAFVNRLTFVKKALSGGDARSASAEQYQRLSQQIHELQNDLNGSELEWAFRPQFDLGASFDAVATTVRRSKFLGDEAERDLRQRGANRWQQFASDLGATTPFTGPLLSMRDGRPEKRLSTDTVELQSAIDSFLHQGFVQQRAGNASLKTMLPDQKLMWNPRLLQQSAAIYESYERFGDKGLKLFSADLRGAIDAAARDRVGMQMMDVLKDAQVTADSTVPSSMTKADLENSLREGLDRFITTQKPLNENIDALSRLDLHDQRRALIAATTNEAVRLLRLDDELMKRNAPYATQGDLAWADANVPPAPGVWGARDPAALQLYLDSTRDRLSQLARGYAKPLLDWMSAAGSKDLPENADVVARWQSIVDDLNDYEAKKPNNAIAAIEDYIGRSMTKVTMKDCAVAIPAALPPRRAGYLAARLNDLSGDVSHVCWTAQSHEAQKRYRKLADFFNERLANRYPFATAFPAGKDLEADPDAIRAFYQMFDESAPLIIAVPVDTSYGAPLGGDVRRFMESMQKVRVFFAAFLDPAKARTKPEVVVEPEFRTLARREVAGNEIVDWSMSVGHETITQFDKKKVAWMPGQDVVVTLRWAKDGPHAPLKPEGKRLVKLDENSRTLTYEYRNTWSLLCALRDLSAQADDLGANTNPLPVTLSFVVPTKAAEKALPLDGPARVFMRVSLLTPDGAPVEIPYFPPKAPPLAPFLVGDLR